MSNHNNRPADWTPEDDDPEYNTPFGKLPNSNPLDQPITEMLPKRNPDDQPTGEFVDFSSFGIRPFEPLDAEEIAQLINKRTARVLEKAKWSACTLAGEWWNFLGERERHGKTPAEKVAWTRAHDLFFALLPQYVAMVQQSVANQIEREFDGMTGQQIANRIRAVDLEANA